MSLKRAIAKLKENKNIILVHERPNLKPFSIINKGDLFKTRSCWEIDNSSIYVVSFNNSYRINVVKAELEYRPHYVSFICLCCYCNLNRNIPDTIIRPNTLVDKFFNLFFHQNIKLKHHPEFNIKYHLMSENKDEIVKLISNELINSLLLYDDIYVEINNKKCLIYSPQPIGENNGLMLVEIAESLMAIR